MKIKPFYKYFVLVALLFSFLQYGKASAEGTQVTVAGTIRNIGQGWFVISDNVHVPINITKVVTESDRITVWHSVGAKL